VAGVVAVVVREAAVALVSVVAALVGPGRRVRGGRRLAVSCSRER
jgi:hypothetical protein